MYCLVVADSVYFSIMRNLSKIINYSMFGLQIFLVILFLNRCLRFQYLTFTHIAELIEKLIVLMHFYQSRRFHRGFLRHFVREFFIEVTCVARSFYFRDERRSHLSFPEAFPIDILKPRMAFDLVGSFDTTGYSLFRILFEQFCNYVCCVFVDPVR